MKGFGRSAWRIVWLGMVLMGMCGQAWSAVPARGALLEAEKLFVLGRHAEAAALLDRMTRTNRSSADLWFNLGQARAHCGEMGHAVSAWRRGLQVAPRDTAIRSALGAARARTGSAGDHPLAEWTGWVRPEEWAGLALVGSLGFCGVLVLRRVQRPGPGPGWLVAMMLLQLGAGLGWGLSWLGREWSPDAVVVVKEAGVVQAPVVQAKAVRSLAEGSEVRVLREFGYWVEVGLNGTRLGWVERSSVALD